jgi:histidine phosphotransferase ChpT
MAASAEARRLAETLAARLCHDLGGPIGSLNQALELAALELSHQSEAFVLARHAAAELAHKIRLMRAAWGAGGAEMGLDALKGFVKGLRAAVDLAALEPSTLWSPAMARVLLNVLLLANESLPRGGRIALSGNAADIFVAIDGPTAAWPAGLALCLSQEAAALAAVADPRTLQVPLTALLAFGLGLRLSILLGGAKGAVPPLRLSES